MKSISYTQIKIFLGGMIVLFFFTIATLGPIFWQLNPSTLSLADRYAAPTSQHPFGLDENGSDIFAKIIYGSKISLFIAISVVCLSLLIGLTLGSLAGLFGKYVDALIMRFTDLITSIPGFLLAIALVAVLGPSMHNLIFALCLTSWAGVARLVRGEVVHLREKDYVLSAVSLGSGPLRVLFFHIWPNLFGVLMVHATFMMSSTIISEAGLSFLGLGVPAEVPTWGSLLNSGRRFLTEAPQICFFPATAILFLVMGFNLIGEGCRDLFDPRSKS